MTFARTLLAAAVFVAAGSTAWAQQADMKAQDFATMAASSDMLEIQSSQRALEAADSAAVKEFAQMMINDHTTASKDLMAAAQQDGVQVPQEMMTAKHAETLKSLEGVTGADFDASYVDAQVAAHKEALALMQSYAENGDGAALKAHAQKTAPIIQMHLEHVEKLDQSM